jgi:hypothetical protein
MMTTEAKLLSRRSAAIARVGHSTLISASRALNVEIWDVEGKRHVDFTGGIAVVNTIYCHPKIVAAVRTHHGEVGHVDACRMMRDQWQADPGFRVWIDVEQAGESDRQDSQNSRTFRSAQPSTAALHSVQCPDLSARSCANKDCGRQDQQGLLLALGGPSQRIPPQTEVDPLWP